MREDEIRREVLFYVNQATKVFVYKGVLLTRDLPAVIKDQHFATVDEANFALQEALNQVRLAHPNIVSMYDIGISKSEDDFLVSIAVELMERDLQKEIESRQADWRFWTEEELWTHIKALIDAFAYAQRCSVCHRDIKPQNLFFDSSGTVKIGDFGSSKALFADSAGSTQTLQGSPYYLSPILKRQFIDSFSSQSREKVAHDPYKSDVFSLGLTLLYMAKLEPSKNLARADKLRDAVRVETSGLRYSKALKSLLRLMLEENEEARMDFLSLKDYLVQLQHDATDTDTTDFSTLLAQINTDPQSENLRALLQSDNSLHAEVTISMVCYVCSDRYQLDVTQGCSSVESLYFCSQICCEQYTNAARPNEELKGVMELCVLCNHNRVAVQELPVCDSCQRKQLQATSKVKTESCVQCEKKWPKQTKFGRLFRKYANPIRLPTCKHKVCSENCLRNLVRANGRKCSSCCAQLPDLFLQQMKIT